jgi:hypothetical protein
MQEIDNYRDKKYTGKEARLFREWETLEKRFGYGKDERIWYIIHKRNSSGLPVAYAIHFQIRSITGVNPPDEQGLQTPIFGDKHILHITLPDNYPGSCAFPRFEFSTDVWHPQVRFSGDFQGRIDICTDDHGTQTRLAEYIDRVVDYLNYDYYHAKNECPYPEDMKVAEWVLNQAEPNGWLNFKQTNNSVTNTKI